MIAQAQIAELAPDRAVGPQLHRLVRARIIRGDLPPGTRISETEIAAEYVVSRQPVREAFIKLSEEALVEVRPQRGTYVRRISVPAVMTARFVREAVEADIARLVARTASSDMMRALDEMIAAQRAIVQDADPDAFMQLDEDFHRVLATLAGQAAAWEILEGLKIEMNRVRHISTRHLPREKLIDQHAQVVEAIRAHDADAAEAAMRLHLNEILTDLPAIVEAMPEYFEGRG